jgi:hypothetical protein
VENGNYRELFTTLSDNIDVFIGVLRKKKLNLMATDEWTVKDVLCHLVFWHESYAANYNALAKNLIPPLLDGPGYKLNEESVSSLRRCPTKKLIDRLQKAQNSLYVSIVERGVSKMTYKKDGRVYTTPEFLNVIARHFITHTKQIKRAKQKIT